MLCFVVVSPLATELLNNRVAGENSNQPITKIQNPLQAAGHRKSSVVDVIGWISRQDRFQYYMDSLLLHRGATPVMVLSG